MNHPASAISPPTKTIPAVSDEPTPADHPRQPPNFTSVQADLADPHKAPPASRPSGPPATPPSLPPENPAQVDELEYGELELQAAKSNEQAVLYGGLDAQVRWVPASMHAMSAREALTRVLADTAAVAEALGRTQDLELIRRAAAGEVAPPAERIRQEAGAWYGIETHSRHNARLLPDDSYPRELLRRTREAMALELDQIAEDLPRMPEPDRPRIASLLASVRRARVAS